MSEYIVLTTVPVRIEVELVCEDAIANTRIGEKVVLTKGETVGDERIFAINEARQVIGWLPASDLVIDRLINSPGYRATVRKIIRGRYGRRFDKIVLDVSTVAGTIGAGAHAK